MTISMPYAELVTPAPKTSNYSSDYYDYLNVVTSEGIRNCKVSQFIVQDCDFLKVIEAKDLNEYKFPYPEKEEGYENKAYIYNPNEGHTDSLTSMSLPENLWEVYNALRSYTAIESGTVEFDKGGEIQRLVVNFKLK